MSEPFVDLIGTVRFVRRHIVLIFIMAIIGLSAGVAYAFLATKVYRAEVILVVTAEDDDSPLLSSLQGTLGGLAGLAGFQLGGSGNARNEAIAYLKSRTFIEGFLRDEQLLPVLFEKGWDSDKGSWINEDAESIPSLEDGYILFRESVLSVVEDRRTSLLTVKVEWSDRELAAEWANTIVERANHLVRQRAIEQSDLALEYLREEIEKASFVELERALYSVVQGQIQKRTLAKTRPDYAFRVIDPAVASDYDRFVTPKRLLAVASGLMFGAFFGLLIALVRAGFAAVNAAAVHDQ